MKTKVCAKCGKELPVEQFYKSKVNKSGYSSYCKACNNKVSNMSRRPKTEVKEPKHQVEAEHQMHKVYTNKDLAKFEPRELMLELKARGYEGELIFREVKVTEHRINLGRLN